VAVAKPLARAASASRSLIWTSASVISAAFTPIYVPAHGPIVSAAA
jgi:hypothetical protein